MQISTNTASLFSQRMLQRNQFTLNEALQRSEKKLTQYSNIKLDKIRLGIPENYFYENLDPETEAVMTKTQLVLKKHRIQLIPITMPSLSLLVEKTAFPIAFYEVKEELPIYLEQNKTGLTMKDIVDKIASPDVKQAFTSLMNKPISKAAYQQAINDSRPELQKLYARTFKKYKLDAIAFPTTVLPARAINNSLYTVMLNNKEVPTVQAYSRNTIPSANAGIPSISIPVGCSAQGLPVSLELDGPVNNDEKLLQLSKAIEPLFKERLCQHIKARLCP